MSTGLTPTEFSSAVTAITSAFGDPTRREIYLFVHERSEVADEAGEASIGVTAADVAERFALHPNVARHHLDKLAGGGYVEVATGRSGTGAGRPSKRYRVTSPEMTLDLALRHDDLLVTLLGKALSMLPPQAAETMAEEVGLKYGQAMAAAMGPSTAALSGTPAAGAVQRSFRTALHAVADALTAHGFAAHAERHGDGLRIVSDHCPFGGAAIEHPVICAVDRGLVRGMLGALYGEADAATSSSRPMGDDRCITDLSHSEAELPRRSLSRSEAELPRRTLR
jgi:predicted ArsR family transcriptional regulator